MSKTTPNRSWNARHMFNCPRESQPGKVSIEASALTEPSGRFKTEAIKAVTNAVFVVVMGLSSHKFCGRPALQKGGRSHGDRKTRRQIGRASCRERV